VVLEERWLKSVQVLDRYLIDLALKGRFNKLQAQKHFLVEFVSLANLSMYRTFCLGQLSTAGTFQLRWNGF
jgi:hypothetical protein